MVEKLTVGGRVGGWEWAWTRLNSVNVVTVKFVKFELKVCS